VLGDGYQAGLLDGDVLGQHAVDVAAESASGLGGGGWSVEPILHENSGDAVTGLPERDAFSHSCHFAGSIGAGDAGKLQFGVVEALDDQQIAIIERNRAHPDEDFAGLGGGGGALYKL
jgi:hypothetical protein